MKKCASCTKDLPDAALHCVFCGAKQAPAPAQAGNAKTVMGYSSNEVLEQLKAQQEAARAAAGQAPPPQQQAPMNAPMPAPFVPSAAPYVPPAPAPAPYTPPAPIATAGGVQSHAASAATVFVQNAGPPPGMAAHQQATVVPQQAPVNPAMQPTMMPQHNPQPSSPQYTPPAPVAQNPYQPVPVGVPIAAAAPPYLASTTAARAGRPIEPWKDTLRLVMFVFGGLLLAAFCTPLSTDPMVFNWNVVLDGSGSQKIGPLLIAAIGLVSILIAAIPMTTAPRGMLAAILGLCGALIPLLIGGMPEWPVLSMIVGMIILVPGLLVRSEYRDAALPRILVTVGAIGILLPFVVPMHGEVGIVALFSAITDAPGGLKLIAGLELGMLVIVVLSLLAWLPAPASGGSKLWAWLLLVWGAVVLLTALVVSGHIGDVISGSPYTALSWVAGGAGGPKEAAMLLGLPTAYGALIGYGLATVFGKQLE